MVYRCRDDADWTMEFVSEGCARADGLRARGPAAERPRLVRGAHASRRPRPRSRGDHRPPSQQRPAFDVEYRIRHADGRVRWVWEHGVGVFDERGTRRRDRRHRPGHHGSASRPSRRCAKPSAATAACSTTRSKASSARRRMASYLDANPALARIYGFASPQELDRVAAATSEPALRRSGPPRRIHAHRQGARRDQRLRVAGLPQERRHRSGSPRTRAPCSTRRPRPALRGHGRGHHGAPLESGAHRATGELRLADGARKPLAAERSTATGDLHGRELRRAARRRVRRPRSLQVRQRHAWATTSATELLQVMAERLTARRRRERHGGSARRRRVRAAAARPARSGHGRGGPRAHAADDRSAAASIGTERLRRHLQHRRRAVSGRRHAIPRRC